MDYCERYISDCERQLPDPCTSKDLVEIGIYKSSQQCRYARNTKQGPSYIKVMHSRIVYPKAEVIKYLKETLVCHTCKSSQVV